MARLFDNCRVCITISYEYVSFDLKRVGQTFILPVPAGWPCKSFELRPYHTPRHKYNFLDYRA